MATCLMAETRPAIEWRRSIDPAVAASRSHGGTSPRSFRGTRLAVGGQREDLAPILIGARDETFVGEQLQRRIDRTGARLPRPARALGEFLDDLVAVHRLLGQQRQHGGTDIAPVCLRASAHETAATTAEPSTAARAAPFFPVVVVVCSRHVASSSSVIAASGVVAPSFGWIVQVAVVHYMDFFRLRREGDFRFSCVSRYIESHSIATLSGNGAGSRPSRSSARSEQGLVQIDALASQPT